MLIGQRLRELRESKKMSQGDLEKRTGLLRCYTSRVENGHTVPSVETLEKYARAMEIPLYKLFYEGKKPLKHPAISFAERAKPIWGAKENERNELRKFAKAFLRMDERGRRLLASMAQKMAGRNRTGAKKTGRPPRDI
jgi:transcriptional regulator with XRE-family HTH domain